MSETKLTVAEAAEWRGVSPQAIYAAIASKRLPRRYYKGSLVVKESDLIAWKSKQEKRGRPKGQPMSEEHKARISNAQKLKWAQRKKKRNS